MFDHPASPVRCRSRCLPSPPGVPSPSSATLYPLPAATETALLRPAGGIRAPPSSIPRSFGILPQTSAAPSSRRATVCCMHAEIATTWSPNRYLGLAVVVTSTGHDRVTLRVTVDSTDPNALAIVTNATPHRPSEIAELEDHPAPRKWIRHPGPSSTRTEASPATAVSVATPPRGRAGERPSPILGLDGARAPTEIRAPSHDHRAALVPLHHHVVHAVGIPRL